MTRPKPIRMGPKGKLPDLTDAQQSRIARIRQDFPGVKLRVERRGMGHGVVCVSMETETHISRVWYLPDGTIQHSASAQRMFALPESLKSEPMQDISDYHKQPKE